MQCWFVYRISLKAYSFAECRSLITSNHEPSHDCEPFLLKLASSLCILPVFLTAGIILGFGLRSYNMSYRDVTFFSFPGELLMRMLQMLVLPLLVSSLITGSAVLLLYKQMIKLVLKPIFKV